MNLFASFSERRVNAYRRRLAAIEKAAVGLTDLSNEQLRYKTDALRTRATQGEPFSALLPETFALVREAGTRALGLTAYPAQLIGAQALVDGNVAEMRTGEGKTLVAAFAACLWALPGKGVHVVTANDYLARRDMETLRPLYELLGFTVSVVAPLQTSADKREAYASSITYGTSSEFGFDYLRDQMAPSAAQQVRRGQVFAVVDEVDSLLIDEARTPLIISGDADSSPALYEQFHQMVQGFERQEEEESPGDYFVDEKARQVHLSEQGQAKAEQVLAASGLVPEGSNLYDPHHLALFHHLNVALQAKEILKRDVDYVVQGNQVLLVDTFTGRTQPGRRWNNGIHQAVEVKEGLTPELETRTLASVTIQNYFGHYQKLAGMTGTAATEAEEFRDIYGLRVVVVPTHRPMVRQDFPDIICVTKRDKLRRVIKEVAAEHAKGRPVLIGTPSVAASEEVATLLTEAGLPFSMLNAKQHEREAAIIAKAGEPGAITLATSMAGRGTDIVLGGSIHDELEALDPNAPEDLRANIQAQWQLRHDEVVALGGLHVLGTERQESRRIDNQLRGRAGRQGDPGSSRFYLSLEDDLLRIFASGWIKNLLGAMGMREGAILENAHLSRQVERAQRQMEARNFDARKNLLDYDRVVQEQRRHIYGQRQQLLESPLEELEAKDNAWQILWASYPAFASQSDVLAWGERWSLVVDPASFVDDDPDQHEKIWRQAFEQGWARLGPWETQADRLRKALVDSLDRNWRLHLDRLELLRQGIHLRGFAQKQPLQEYRRDAHGLFQTMVGDIRTEAVAEWMKVPVLAVENLTPPASRNAPCPCGSGLRYKHCHGQLT